MASVQETNRTPNITTDYALKHQNSLPAVIEDPNTHNEDLLLVPEEISAKTINKKSKLDWKLRTAAVVGTVTAIGSTLFPALREDNGRDSRANDEPQRSPVTRSVDNMNSGGWFSPKIDIAEAAGPGDNGNGRGGPHSDPTPIPDIFDPNSSQHPSGNDRNTELGNSYPQGHSGSNPDGDGVDKPFPGNDGEAPLTQYDKDSDNNTLGKVMVAAALLASSVVAWRAARRKT